MLSEEDAGVQKWRCSNSLLKCCSGRCWDRVDHVADRVCDCVINAGGFVRLPPDAPQKLCFIRSL